MRRMLWLLLGIGMALFTSMPAFAQDNLIGTGWRLVSIAGEDVRATITLEFEDGERVGGSGGCNFYGAQYAVNGAALTFHTVIRTLMACEEAIDRVEQAYFAALETVSGYTLTDGTLTLTYGEGDTLVFAPFEALAGTAWALVSRDGQPVIAGATVTLAFGEDGQASGDSGCNLYRGAYTVNGDRLAFGDVISTRRACLNDALTAQEQAYLRALNGPTHYAIAGDTLTITASDGVVWEFARVRTLTGTTWRLETLGDDPVLRDSELTLAFADEGTVTGSGGCNTYSGTYRAEEGTITFEAIVRAERACLDAALMAQEGAFFDALNAVTAYTHTDDGLFLSGEDGELLAFVPLKADAAG